MKRSVLPLVLTVLLLTGCTAGSSDDSAASGGGEAGGAAPAAGAALDPAADAEAGAAAPVLARADLLGSAVVRTAELGVRVDDVRAAAVRAGQLAREAGGGVASERADAARDGDGANAELALRVPPEAFDDLLDRLIALGDERSRSVSSEQVGDQLVDLESRLSTQRASVARVQALLGEAANLGEVVQLEAELTRRTADLESLQARVAALRDSVQLSTVVLRLDSSDDAVLAGGPGGFLDGMSGGWAALLASLAVLATVTGAVLPFVPFAAVALLVLARARRRRSGQVPGASVA